MAWNEPGSGKDPWEGGSSGGGGRGPERSDLEKWLKQLRQRFGGSGKGRGPTGGLVGVAIAAVIVIWLLSGFYTVDAQKRGVVLRFGAIVGVAQPGLSWHAPWPIGSVRIVNVTKLRQASTQSLIMTKDHNLVDVGLTVQFRVSSARAYLFRVANPDDTLTQAAGSVLRSVVAQYRVDAVLGNAQDEIGAKIKQKLQKVLDNYRVGLQVTDVSLTNIHPPKQVQKAFADAIQADNDATKTRNAANAYAQ
ncbi:MAG: FtsH protease activity modulator HflK, partial [Sinobacteraceae bacterium]|nr:FtsH protease activity modulator HflK [Nevskiaceae bacterium]